MRKLKFTKPPSSIIEVCERPGHLDHLKGAAFRVTVETFDAKSRKWKTLTSDTGNEVWLLEYPPHSRMAHYCLQGANSTILGNT